MSTVSDFLRTGVNTGNSQTSTESPLVYSRSVLLNPTTRSATITVPPNSQILGGNVIIETAASGSTTPITVRVGVSASAAQFATCDCSAAGAVQFTLTRFAASLDTVSTGQIVFDATCAGSAAGFMDGSFRARLWFGEK